MVQENTNDQHNEPYDDKLLRADTAECDHRFSVFDLIEILFQRLGPINKVIKNYFSLNANSFLPNPMGRPVDTGGAHTGHMAGKVSGFPVGMEGPTSGVLLRFLSLLHKTLAQ